MPQQMVLAFENGRFQLEANGEPRIDFQRELLFSNTSAFVLRRICHRKR